MRTEHTRTEAAERIMRLLDSAGALAHALHDYANSVQPVPPKDLTGAVARGFAEFFRAALPAARGEALEALVELCVIEALRERLAALPLSNEHAERGTPRIVDMTELGANRF